MKPNSNPKGGRHWRGKALGIYFGYLSDEEVQELIDACEQELELRSQEEMTHD